MGENQKKILDMLAAGKISVDEAQRLLSLIGADRNGAPAGETTGTGGKPAPKYLYVVVEPKQGATGAIYDIGPMRARGKVHIRVPFSLIRAGIKLATLVPPDVADKVNGAMKDRGMDFDVRRIKEEDIERLISGLIDSQINIDSDEETVRVYAE